jgi:asparagine synthase (glutamine-hydrolysing)
MCGIAGIFRTTGHSNSDKEHLKAMLDIQKHRGPDAHGIHKCARGYLGHNRLSIIDLSEQSNQPFNYLHTSIAYNGEIYNYLELKQELRAKGFEFCTGSDTEVICAAYLCWGLDCVNRFVGMWAFAIWDERKEHLFCSRDRFGIKPFNYIHEPDNSFQFASEIRTLKRLPEFNSDLNRAQVARWLNLGLAGYKDETYFKQVKQLRSAHNLLWTKEGVSITRYWDLEKIEVPQSPLQAIEGFRERFLESVKIHMRSDVPVGACLSGGLDSASIVSVMGALYPNQNIKTFTIYYEGERNVDERPFARSLKEKYPKLESYYLQPSDEELEAEFPRFLDHCDVPPSGSSYFSQYFVMKLAASHGIKVALNGQGSDEYTIGYLHSFYHILADELLKGRIDRYLKTLNDLHKIHHTGAKKLAKTGVLAVLAALSGINRFTKAEFQRKFPQIEEGDYNSCHIELEEKFNSRTDNFLYHLLMTTTLPTLLHHEDRNSMAFSIESRVPFLDHRLVEYGFSLPVELRLKNGITKYVLRESMKELLPSSVYERKDKKGFVTPGEISWVNGPLKEYFREGKGKNPAYSWRLNTLYQFGDSVG